MPTLAPDNTPSDVAYGSRQGQPAAVSPALAHQFSLSEFAALKTQLAAQAAEITALKSQLTARDAGTAALKSAIPQSDQSEISNLKSEIPNPHSSHSSHSSQIPHSEFRIPHSSPSPSPSPARDPIAAAFAPLFDNPVAHYIPGGGHIMPTIPREARTSQAGLERLKYLASRAELVLIDKLDRFAVCGIVGSPERDTYEFIMRNIWRLTAVRKSLIAMEANPNAPVPEDLFPNIHATMTDMNMDPVAEINQARSAIQSPSPSPSPSQSEFKSPSPSQSISSDQSVGSVGSVQSDNPQSAIQNPQSPSAPSVPSVPPVPASPSIPSVPQCPTYSPENLVRTLDRTTAELSSAGILPAHSSTSANPHTPTKSPSPSQSQSSSVHSVNDVNDVHSTSDIGPLTSSSHVDLQTVVFIPYADPATLANLPPQDPDPPCPKATDPANPSAPRPQCTECDASMCPSRIAVPIFTGILKRTQRCDGACRFCSPKRQHNCPYTLPKYRDGPK